MRVTALTKAVSTYEKWVQQQSVVVDAAREAIKDAEEALATALKAMEKICSEFAACKEELEVAQYDVEQLAAARSTGPVTSAASLLVAEVPVHQQAEFQACDWQPSYRRKLPNQLLVLHRFPWR